MKVIFLDIDGVLNSKDYFISNREEVKKFYKFNIYNKDNIDLLVERQMMDIDYNKLTILKKVIEETNAKIVITSTWKNFYFFSKIVEKFNELGIHIIGHTEDAVVDRGNGIKKYLQEHDVTSYAVLDDDVFQDYDETIMDRLIKTSFFDGGLHQEDGKKLIKILKS